MNIILLSGGSGKRLWPLSNDIRSKQFIKCFRNEEGTYESMLQRVYHQIHTVDSEINVTIATSKSQLSFIHNQIDSEVGICVEPCRRDTFPAIALASAYLHDIKGVGDDEPVVVCPVDPYVETEYFEMIAELGKQVQRQEANLVLMGIEPTEPSEKYGYIIPRDKERISMVDTFQEKPDRKTAEDYICQGALWNGGVFAYQLKYVLQKVQELIGYSDYAGLYSNYDSLTKISFDYAVVEKEPLIQVMRFSGVWNDLGTWNTLTEAIGDSVVGEAVLGEGCRDVNVVNELDVPVLCMGLDNVIVSATTEGILVSDRERASYIKPYVDEFDQRVMFAEKSWGSFRILDVEENSLTIKVTLNKGNKMNYHSHKRRDEVWTIISGNGIVVVDGMEQEVTAGDVVTMEAGCRHTIFALTELKLIEVQLGKDISIDDKQKYEWDYKRYEGQGN